MNYGILNVIVGVISFLGSLITIAQALINYFYYDIQGVSWGLVIFLILLFTSVAMLASVLTSKKVIIIIPQVYSVLYFVISMFFYLSLVYQNAYSGIGTLDYFSYLVMFLVPLVLSQFISRLIEDRSLIGREGYAKILTFIAFIALLPMGHKYVFLMGDINVTISISQVFSEVFICSLAAVVALYMMFGETIQAEISEAKKKEAES